MHLIEAIILGIVEGITEFLPISSTGHLVLASNLLNIPQTDFVKSFEIAIQAGAILSVLTLYWKSLTLNTDVLKKIIVAFMPTAILGAIFYKIIKNVLLDSEKVIVYSLLIGGILIILFEYFFKEKKEGLEKIEEVSYKKCIIIGLFQSIAMVPGVSRAAATIIGGLLLGLRRKTIVEFSFLLAIPTMLAATGLDLMKSSLNFSANEFLALGVGFFFSFMTAIIAIKFLLSYIQKHNFVAFGIYRIVLALIFILFVFRASS